MYRNFLFAHHSLDGKSLMRREVNRPPTKTSRGKRVTRVPATRPTQYGRFPALPEGSVHWTVPGLCCRQFPLQLPRCMNFKGYCFSVLRLRSGPFEGPVTVKPPALSGGYLLDTGRHLAGKRG